MIRSSIIITIIFGINTIAQLLNQIITTRLMGAGVDYDIFLASVTIPGLLTTLFASTLIDIGAPEYARHRSDEWLLGYIIFFTLISVVCAVIGIITAPVYIPLLLGVSKSAIFISRTVLYTQISLASVPLIAIASASSACWYATKRIYRGPIVSLIGSVLLTVLSALTIRRWGINGLVFSSITSSVISVVFLIPFASLDFRKISHCLRAIDKQHLLYKWIPLVIGTFAMRSDGILVRALTSNLPEGHFVYINIVYKVVSAAAGLLSIGIQISLLSTLLESIKQGDHAHARQIAIRAKILSILALVVVGLGIYFLGPLAIRILYVGGKFHHIDAVRAAETIPYFIPVFLGMGMFPIWIQPVLVIRRQRLAGLIGVIGFAVAFTVGKLLPIQNPLLLVCTILTGMYLFFVGAFEYVWNTSQL